MDGGKRGSHLWNPAVEGLWRRREPIQRQTVQRRGAPVYSRGSALYDEGRLFVRICAWLAQIRQPADPIAGRQSGPIGSSAPWRGCIDIPAGSRRAERATAATAEGRKRICTEDSRSRPKVPGIEADE